VHARKGKFVRAEPVSALFEQNRVKIAGSFPELEDQLCTYDGSGNSPDRLGRYTYNIASVGQPLSPSPILGERDAATEWKPGAKSKCSTTNLLI
jgi:phage terminase large subunit-like protein